MNRFYPRIRTWAQENKVVSAMIVGGGLGLLFLTGTPIWWEPSRRGAWVVWQWGRDPHGISGWVLGLMAPVVMSAYTKGAIWLWRLWRPVPVTPTTSPKIAQQDHAEKVVEVIEGVQWRCVLYGGQVHQLESHCPKCLFKIDPKPGRAFRGEVTAYDCDGCRDFEVQINGSSFRVEERITRLIEAKWLQRQESATADRG